ncbi:helix-turn-helix domain-containing protein [Butyricicoccus sp.]
MRNDEILTVKETAALLKTTRQQVSKMIENEELPAVKAGREWRILKTGIMEFFEANMSG